MATIYIPDNIMDVIKTMAAIESTTPEQFIEHAITLAVGRVERKHERARRPREIRVFVKRGDGFVLNPVIKREREFDRLMGKADDEHS